MSSRFRFEVRVVVPELRVHRYVDDYRLYHDACIAADVGHQDSGDDFVVWDARERKVLYDSRLLEPKGERNDEHGAGEDQTARSPHRAA